MIVKMYRSIFDVNHMPYLDQVVVGPHLHPMNPLFYVGSVSRFCIAEADGKLFINDMILCLKI